MARIKENEEERFVEVPKDPVFDPEQPAPVESPPEEAPIESPEREKEPERV